MQRLYQQVEEHNIYRWAASFLSALAAARTPGSETTDNKNAVA
jgi:trehalose-6-phosphate synthase